MYIGGRRDPRERYIDTLNGQIISKRQRERVRRGGLTNEQFQAARAARGAKNPMRRYQSILDDYERRRRQQGYHGTRGALRREQDIQQALRDLSSRRPGERLSGRPGERYSPRKTRALVMLGRISEAWLLEAGYVRGAGFHTPEQHFTAA